MLTVNALGCLMAIRIRSTSILRHVASLLLFRRHSWMLLKTLGTWKQEHGRGWCWDRVPHPSLLHLGTQDPF